VVVELVLGMTLDQTQAVVLSGVEAAKHKLLCGVTGGGKSKLVAGLAVQLMNQRVGICVVDPHGDLCDDILGILHDEGFFADARAYQRLYYLDFTRPDRFVPFNVLDQRYAPHAIAASILEATKRAWPSLAGGSAPALENFILYGCLVLVENRLPLTRLPKLLTDTAWRSTLLRQVSDEETLDFFARLEGSGRRAGTLSDSTLRRVSLLSFDPALRFSLGQAGNILRMRELMDRGVCVLADLKGLPAETQRFIGALLSISIEEAALSRADIPEESRRSYHYLMDEFSQFSARSAESFERILALTRKYGLSLLMACQTLGQVPTELRSSLQNTTLMTLRLGAEDSAWAAERLVTFDPERLTYSATGRPSFMSASEQVAELRRELMSLPPREALLRVGDQTIHFQTLGVRKAQATREQLAAVKERYATLLLTPRAQIEAQAQRNDQRPRMQDGTDNTAGSRVIPLSPRRRVPL
jgi:hypothetical protein